MTMLENRLYTDLSTKVILQDSNIRYSSFKKLEARKIPDNIDYEQVMGLRLEARQKLEAVRPVNIGQASRISGVSPADVNMLFSSLKYVRCL